MEIAQTRNRRLAAARIRSSDIGVRGSGIRPGIEAAARRSGGVAEHAGQREPEAVRLEDIRELVEPVHSGKFFKGDGGGDGRCR